MTIMNRFNIRKLAALSTAAASIALPLAGVEAFGSAASAQSSNIVLTEEDYYTGGSAYTFWNSAFAEYHKLHPNITIKRKAVPETGYIPLLLDQAGAGTLPNIVMIDNPYVAQFASTGVLMPLEKIGSINVSDIAPTELYDGIYKGTVYAIPPYTNTIAVFYNKTIFASAHLSPPTTWAQLISDAKQLTTSQVYGFVTAMASPSDGLWTLAPFLWSNAGTDATSDINSANAVAALNVFAEMAKDGSMPKAVTTWTGGQDTELFEKGKAAMDLNGSWNIPTMTSTKGLDFGVIPIPTRSSGQKLYVPTGGETWTIPRVGTSAQQQAALGFLNWLITPKEDATEAVQVGGLIPTVKSAVPMALAEEPASVRPYLQAFATELVNGGTERTKFTGTAFNAVNTAVSNAAVAAIVGSQSPANAFDSIAGTVQSELSAAGELKS
jgi:multiple sugar transport system substrate-binding protein